MKKIYIILPFYANRCRCKPRKCVMCPNTTQANFQQLHLRILQWWITYVSTLKSEIVMTITVYKHKCNWEFKLKTLTFHKNRVICFIEIPLKMIKNAFYFILKALFVLKIFNFLLWLFGHAEKTAWLER